MKKSLIVVTGTTLPPRQTAIVDSSVNSNCVSVLVTNYGLVDTVLHVGHNLARNADIKTPRLGVRVDHTVPLSKNLTMDQLYMSDHLISKERVEFLWVANKYRTVFAPNIAELGCARIFQMDIGIKPSSQLVTSKPYRDARNDREEIAYIIGEWRQQGIVENTFSPYASLVILVRKKSGEGYMVVDLRRLKQQPVKKL